MGELRVSTELGIMGFDMEGIAPEEFENWRHDPITKKIVNIISNFKEEYQDRLINGFTLCGVNTAEETAKVVGVLYGIDLFLKAKYGDEDE